MTRAIRIHRPGGPEVLVVEDVATPPPRANEARVRHTAIGVNFIDVYFRTGLYPPGDHPFTPGMEAAGVIEALGPGVQGFAVGDRVAYASRPLGAYAEARNMPADRLVKLPANVDDATAAAILLKGMTAEYLLCRTFAVDRAHTILVHAAAGGVGSLLCQWARHLGATVIGTVGTEAKATEARAHGCQHAIVYTRESFVARVAEITAGRGVDVVYDSVGITTFLASFECVRTRGMVVSFGQSSGPPPPIELSLLAKRSLFLTRPGLPDYVARRDELEASAARVFDLVARGVLRVRVGQTYPLADAARAHRDLEGRKTTGSSLLIP